MAVTVYPDRARVTRRGTVVLPAGQHRVRIAPLPLGLHRDSVRVGGQGPATVLGVDVLTDHQPRTTDETAAAVEEQRRQVSAEITELADHGAVETQRAEFLTLLAQRAGGTYARALASGDATGEDVAAFADSIARQLAESRERQREFKRRADEARDRLAALDRQLQALTNSRRPDRLAVEVTVAVAAGDGGVGDVVAGDVVAQDGDAADSAEVTLELSYVVDGAGWQSSYDVRLVDQTLTLTWFGLVSQRTGEDWPECELLLSTARPAATANLPELEPWYLDRLRPLPPPAPMAAPAGAPMPDLSLAVGAAGAADGGPRRRAAAKAAARVTEQTAQVEQGVAAATYRPARAVAVPADGAAHRATVAAVELSTTLDYVTAPVRAAEAHLRATVVNSSTHTMLPGPAAVFHGADFVGTIALPTWAPGEEVELALGVDDRIRVERELVRRSDTKATLGSTRRRETEHQITVTNHTARPARVTILDQLPVSRDEAITVRDARLDPPPAERSELGELTWRFELAPGQSTKVVTGVRVEFAKGVELVGWRE